MNIVNIIKATTKNFDYLFAVAYVGKRKPEVGMEVWTLNGLTSDEWHPYANSGVIVEILCAGGVLVGENLPF